jgi:hypothetical protein
MIGLLMLLADTSYSTFMTGKDLSAICHTNRAACIQYVEGASDMVSEYQASQATPKAVCFDPSATGDHLADITIKFLADHPDYFDDGAGGAVWSALYEAFPCPK